MLVNQLPRTMRRPPFFADFRLTTAMLGAALLLVIGCAGRRPASQAASHPAGAEPSATPRMVHRVVGEVAVVNVAERFVLVDLGANLYVPVPGEPLRASGANGETAHLKTSPEQKRPFIAADIIDGQPKVGDEVWR